MCLGLVSNVVKDDILDPVVNFAQQYMFSENWQARDASVMALGTERVLLNPS